jgi:hypothetical protein
MIPGRVIRRVFAVQEGLTLAVCAPIRIFMLTIN